MPPYIHPRKIRRRRADSDRGGARRRPAPVAVVRGHPEGKRRREPTRSKGPGICRKAGPGVNGRGADSPPLSRSVLPAVPATQTVKPAACQDPLCPFCFFRRYAAEWRWRRKGAHICFIFVCENGKIPDQKMMNFSILQIRDFLRHIWAYFGAERRQFSSFFRVT